MLIEAGDANTTPKNDVTNAINKPKGHNLNSAWQPEHVENKQILHHLNYMMFAMVLDEKGV